MIFLDVGAHDGQTLEEVTQPRYDFERIYAFEPMPAQYETVRRRFGVDPRVKILNCGLAGVSGPLKVYGTNERLEASVYPDKSDVDTTTVTVCDFVEASWFFELHIPDVESAVMKLNCEGAEVAIMNNLIDTGQVWKLKHVAIDFDVRKIPGMEHLEGDLIDRMHYVGFDRWGDVDDLMTGHVHQERIRSWLDGLSL